MGWAAAANIAGVVAGVFGVSYKYLENEFGNAKNILIRNTWGSPKRMAGLSWACTSVPTAIGGLLYGGTEGHLLAFTGLMWCFGNSISAMLPRDNHVMRANSQPQLIGGKPASPLRKIKKKLCGPFIK